MKRDQINAIFGIILIIIFFILASYLIQTNLDYVKGLMGLIMMFHDLERKDMNGMRSFKGNIQEVHTCIGTKGVEPANIDILMKAYFGLIPEEPFDDLASCYVGYLSMAHTFDKTFNDETAQSLGSLIGTKFGSAVGIVALIYDKKPSVIEEIEYKAKSKYLSLVRKEQKEIKATLSKNRDICKWYGIPLESIFDAAVIGAE